jgi:hypothetical protein
MTSFFSPGPGTKPTLNHRRFMFLPKKLGLLLILTIQPSSMETTPKRGGKWRSNERALVVYRPRNSSCRAHHSGHWGQQSDDMLTASVSDDAEDCRPEGASWIFPVASICARATSTALNW